MKRKELEEHLCALAAPRLMDATGDLDLEVALTCYGLDSVAAVELTVALEEWSGRSIPVDLLYECPSISALADYFEGGQTESVELRDAMIADSILPSSIHPQSNGWRPGPPGVVLLTGATGFVGTWALDALLRQTKARIICFVRCKNNSEGLQRLHASRQRFGLPHSDLERVTIEPGDLQKQQVGLTTARFDQLGDSVDTICHCAAEVNWVAGYSALRDTNVHAVRELLALACKGRTSAFVFLSSLATCYSTNAPEEVPEDAEPADWFEGLHFGYAQSKAVAETLVREAGSRGLPVTILRPSLITGDSCSGRGNNDDFVSLLLKGCIEIGYAPDLDWLMDFCPVDHMAELIAGTVHSPSIEPRVLHVLNPRKRHWREAVLWMILSGFPLRLEPYAQWLNRFNAACTKSHFALRPLQSFFAEPVSGQGGLTIPELLEESRRSQATTKRTAEVLPELQIGTCPRLDGHLLDRYFSSFVSEGFLQSPRGGEWEQLNLPQDVLPVEFFQKIAESAAEHQIAHVLGVKCIDQGSDHGIITEMTAWGCRRVRGLFRHRIQASDATGQKWSGEIMIKLKPLDHEVLDVGLRVAELCHDNLGRAYARFRSHLDFNGCDRRELAIYQLSDEKMRHYLPKCHGVLSDSPRGVRALALECLDGLVLMDSANRPDDWTTPAIDAAIRGLAVLHATWDGRQDELRDKDWMPPDLSVNDVVEMTPLWRSLADYARPVFGEEVHAAQIRIIDGLADWWPKLRTHHRTLVHKDFNPRNLGLREEAGGLHLCVYDWELAAWGAPQRDLAEFLCFVLRTDSSAEEIDHWINLHRSCLETEIGEQIDADIWREGFRLSLQSFMLERLPFYAMINRFRPQHFLPRVVRCWSHLYQHVGVRSTPLPSGTNNKSTTFQNS
jgi:thioester reductase-like protein